MDARDLPRSGYPSDSTSSLVGVGLQDELPAADHTTTTRRNGAGAPPRIHHGPRGPGRQEPGGPAGSPLATSDPTLPPAPPSAPPPSDWEGSAHQDTPDAATFLLCHHPRPPCGRGWCRSAGRSGVRGGTPRNHPLSYSGRRRAVPTSLWPWASDGQPLERLIVGSCRYWRPRGRSVGAG